MDRPDDPTGGTSTRSARVADDLRRQLEDGVWPPGTRLPGEVRLAETYGVSRATIRTALRSLESRGLTATRHGSGTYATGASPGIHADLRHLDSMTATIRRVGAVPSMIYRRRELAPADAEQARHLDLHEGDPVFVTERELRADDTPVAFSYDVLPGTILPDDLAPETIEGSLYELLRSIGVDVAWATAEVHAATGGHIGWGERPSDAVYVLLDQVHRTIDGNAVAWSRTYYLEGRFRFSLVRTR